RCDSHESEPRDHRRVPPDGERRQARGARETAIDDSLRRAKGARMHLLRSPGVPSKRNPCRLWRRGKALRVLPDERLDCWSFQGRPEGLRHEQRNDPVQTGQALARGACSKTGEGSTRGERNKSAEASRGEEVAIARKIKCLEELITTLPRRGSSSKASSSESRSIKGEAAAIELKPA